MAKTKKETFNPHAAADALAKELNSIVTRSVGDTGIRNLGDVDYVPYYLSTDNLALNWAVSGKMLEGGVPASKVIMVYGEPGCLHGDTEVEVMIDEKLLEFLDT